MVLAFQTPDLLALLSRGQSWPQPTVGLGLAHALAQHLHADPEIPRDLRDGPAGVERQPHTALDQLLWILPGSGHELAVPCSRTKSSFQSLRQIQGSSVGTSQYATTLARKTKTAVMAMDRQA